MSNRKLIKKTIYAVEVSFCSPMSVSSGNNETTDSDIIRDLNGNPFLPGSTLAGACRDYLDLLKDQPGFMGYAKDNDGTMSRLMFMDMQIQNPKIINRDGVGLDEDKNAITGAKFDLEAIDSGATGVFKMELITREEDDDVSDEICSFLRGIHNGEIRIGSKKTRGYGRMQVLNAYKKEFTKDNIEEYAEAYTLNEDIKSWDEFKWKKDTADYRKYVKVVVPLRNTGCISIRQYQAISGEPDYIHIHSNNKPVIPGTSFAGAIKKRTREILKEAMGNEQIAEVDGLINEVFGYVEQKKKDARKSDVVFGESVITAESSHNLTISRTAISRFESAAKDKALYQETTCVGGTLNLEILVKKSIAERIIPLLMPALLDLQKGYLPVGGLVSIGRGILSSDGEIKIEGTDNGKCPHLEEVEGKKVYNIENYSIERIYGEAGAINGNHE